MDVKNSIHTVLSSGVGILPLFVAAAWLTALTVTRWQAYRRRRLLPPELVNALELVGQGVELKLEADRDPHLDHGLGAVLDRLALRRRSALASAVLGVTAAAGRLIEERRAALEDALDDYDVTVGAPSSWFDVLYATSTLFSVICAIIAIVAPYENSAGAAVDSPALNAAVVAAMKASGFGACLSIVARVIGEWFHQRHERIRAEIKRLLLPVVAALDSPPAPRPRAVKPKGSAGLKPERESKAQASKPINGEASQGKELGLPIAVVAPGHGIANGEAIKATAPT